MKISILILSLLSVGEAVDLKQLYEYSSDDTKYGASYPEYI